MNSLFAAKLKWQIYRLSALTSLVAWVAWVLMFAALLCYMLVYKPLATHQANLNNLPITNTHFLKDAHATSTDHLKTYVAQFPAIALRASKMNDFMALVAQQNLQLDEVSYKTEKTANQPFSRYQVAFSVFASYPEVHQLLSAVLTKMPFVAIDSLEISRQNVLDEIVEARIQLTFYFESASYNEP